MLKRGFRNASILLQLLNEKVEQRFGKNERVRDVATRVFVDGLLAPRIELSCVECVGIGQEDLRRGDDDAYGWTRSRGIQTALV